MDIVSVAASLTALITIAIQGTKAIYQTVQQIKDGPAHVQRLATKAEALRQTLQQLATLITEADLTSGSNLIDLFTNLQSLVEACAEELRKITNKLESLRVAVGGKHVRRAWVALKAVLKEKDREDMWKVLQSQTETLNSQLIIIGTRLGIDHTQRFEQLNNVLGSSLQTITARFDRLGGEASDVRHDVVKRFDRLEESLEVRHNSHQDIIHKSDRQQAKALDLLGSNLDGMRGDFGSRFDLMDQQNQSFSQASHQAANHLSARLESLSKVSQEQSETIINLLRQIQQQNNSHHVEESIPASQEVPQYTPAQADSFKRHPHVDDGIADTIDRLCLLASKKPQTVSSDEAQFIIEDLESILNVVIAKEEEVCSLRESGRKRKMDRYANSPGSGSETQYWRDVKRVRRILSASQSVMVNDKIKGGRCMPSVKGKLRSRAESREYQTKFGTIQVKYITKQAVEVLESRGQGQESNSLEVTEVFLGTFSLFPANTNKHQTKMSASFCQRIMKDGCNLLHPLLSFCSIIPDNSMVFEVVSTGDMNGLIELFETGAAAPTDCDTKGRSLLNYALTNLQTTISAFLIDHGADVNAVELNFRNELSYPLLAHMQLDNRDSDLSEVPKCQRLLLDAEADPNMFFADVIPGTSIFTDAVEFSRVEFIRIYMNSVGPLINIEDSDPRGRTALLIALDKWYLNASFTSSKDRYEKVAFLLDRGADITARDSSGRGCLHYLFPVDAKFLVYAKNLWLPNNHETRRIAGLLLNRGADVHAVDCKGYSVTRSAYESGDSTLWERALIDCGFDAEEIFAPLYEDFPAARCSCGRPRAQKRRWGWKPSPIHVENLPYCTHVSESKDSGKERDEALSMADCEMSGRASPDFRGDSGQWRRGEDWSIEDSVDWGIEDSEVMGLERTASPILEGSW